MLPFKNINRTFSYALMILNKVFVLSALSFITLCADPSYENIKFECENGIFKILVNFDYETEIIEYGILRRKDGEDSFSVIYSNNEMTFNKGNVLIVDIGFIEKQSDSQYKLSITTEDEMKIYYDPFYWDQEKNTFVCLKS
jgi:hypothetical protein